MQWTPKSKKARRESGDAASYARCLILASTERKRPPDAAAYRGGGLRPQPVVADGGGETGTAAVKGWRVRRSW